MNSTVARLRAECAATDGDAARAVLLHELGVLEETLGDEASAAHDQLDAANSDPEFREPIERLIGIVQRRDSPSNLAKLYDRLVLVATTPEERRRALLERALFLARAGSDLERSRASLEEALEDGKEDAAIWYALEVVAGQLDDEPLRTRALGARAELAKDATWRGLLLIDLARSLAATSDGPGALRALEQALENGGAATFSALVALEELAGRESSDDLLARALSGQARLILQAIEDGAAGDARGVPRYRRTGAHAAACLLRSARALARSGGNLADAAAMLELALEQVPGDPAVLHARRALADACEDVDGAARIAQATLAASVSGPLAASLHLRVAESAAAAGDGARALEAVKQALSADPESIPGRALQLDLLSTSDPASLGSALEATADQLESEEAKARLYLLAADVWARLAGDRQGARAALSQAGMYGAGPATLGRVGRLLAGVTDDSAWYEEATRRLLAAGAPAAEQGALWLELVRGRLLRGEVPAALQAVEGLAATSGGEWLASVLTGYAVPLADRTYLGNPAALDALGKLARHEDDGDNARGLRTVLALRALAGGDADRAVSELEQLYTVDAGDLVVSAMLAALLRGRGDVLGAAEALATAALATSDADVAAALQLESGFLFWRAGERRSAVEALHAARAQAPAAARVVLAWALRSAEPDDLDARRRALEATSEGEDGVAQLERFALELGPGGDPDEAWRALDALSDAAPKDLALAAQLARAVFGSDETDLARRLGACAALGKESAAAAALARSAEFQLLLERGAGAEELEEAAARWANADPSGHSTLEWVGAAVALRDPRREAEARGALARHTGGEVGATIEASARLIAALDGDDTQPLLGGNLAATCLTNLELAPPGCDPRRRASALLGLDDSLGEDSIAVARALAGWSQLASGDLDSAQHSFRSVTEAFPQEIIGWEGLRATGEASGERALVAEACAALGDLVRDAATGAELWEHAALILTDELNDPERGEFALSRAVERDIRRFVAFDRLFRAVRARKDGPRLLELINARLEVADDPAEIGKLFWEQARVLRKESRIEDALAALENVTMLEPDHVGALALSGEIYITRGMFAEAAASLGRLSTLDEAPKQQRLMSGVAAVDLYESKLNASSKALEVLVGLHRAGLSTLPVRERLARTAARVGAWERATEVLEQLMSERESQEGRVEAARLAMAIHRDRLRRPAAALPAVQRLLTDSPSDGEALDLVLSSAFPAPAAAGLARIGREAIVAELARDPLRPELVDRLARIAAFLADAPLRQASLGALVALGEGTAAVDHELLVLEERVARLPQIAIDQGALPDLCDPEDQGPIPELMIALAPTLSVALGPGLIAFGVSKKQRVDPRAGLAIRNEIAAWAGALGIGEFELYVGGSDAHGVYGVPGELPALVVGPSVTAPLGAGYRQAVARELFAIKRGTSILRHRDAADVAAIVVAACRIGGVELPSPHYAMLDEFQRLIGKELPRRLRRVLPELAQAVARSGTDPRAWVPAAVSSLDRLAAVAAGDVSHVLAAASGARGDLGGSLEARQRAARLLGFVLSPAYLALREQMGMGVR